MHGISCASNDIAEVDDELEELLQFRLVWLFMNPVDEWNIHPVEMLGNRFVGRKHEFLNQLLSDRSSPNHNISRFTVFTDKNLRFLEIKIDGAAFHPLFTKDGCKLFHILKHWHQWFIPLN